MAGDDVQGGAEIPMGHRNACVGGNRNGGGDAGDLLEGDLVLGEKLQLLTASAKEEGIAALEAYVRGEDRGGSGSESSVETAESI